MLYKIKTSFILWRLQRSRERIKSAYAKDILKAQKEKKNSDAIQLIEEAERWESEGVQDEIEHLHTRALVKQANKLRVPVPWTEFELSRQHGFRYLTDEGYANLRRTIRAERSERWDMRLRWMPAVASLITAIGGILGILIGLVSVLK